MKIVSLKYDEVFRELFSHENVRKQFLSDILDIPLKEIKSARIVTPYLWRRYRMQKQGILDVALELNDDTRVDVELQIRRQTAWVKRELFYLAKMYTEDLRVGENYNGLRRCVSISLLDFNLLEGEEYHSIFKLRDEIGRALSDLWEVHIIELNKKPKGNGGTENWIRLFNATSREELDMIQAQSAGLTEAIEVMKEMSLGKSLRYLYEARLKAKRDRYGEDMYVRECGRAEGRAEALLDGIRALIETCSEMGLDKEATEGKIRDKFKLSAEDAAVYMKRYWTEAP